MNDPIIREYWKTKREERRKAGKCIRCGKKSESGTCKACKERFAANYLIRQKAKGKKVRRKVIAKR